MNRLPSRWKSFSRSSLLYWLPLLFFLERIDHFWYLYDSYFSDLAISHLPNLVYLRKALIEYRTIPLWSPSILGGFPFFANPLSGLWYPAGWPAVIWPEGWVFNLIAGLHLVFGAFGMGRLLKGLGLRSESQLLGGLAFGMMPKLLSHYAAGHITLVYAVAWTPWLLLAELRPPRGWFRPSTVLAVIIFADPRWAAFSGVLWLAYSLSKRMPGFAAWLRYAVPEAATALMLSAPLLLPLSEYSQLSSRASITPAETLAFSLPPVSLVGLVLPFPNAEWQLYPGVMILMFAVGALVLPSVRKRAAFWLVAGAAAVLFALGDSVPVLNLWASLPIAGLLRVPARAIFVFGFACCVLAAYGLNAVVASEVNAKGRFRWNLLIVGIAGAWTATASFWSIYGFVLTIALGLLFGGVLWVVLNRGFHRRIGIPVLCLCILADLFSFTRLIRNFRSPAEVHEEGVQAAAWLAEQPGRFRVYSPSYSLPQHTAARYGLELASGVDPLQLQAYADFMAKASGVPNTGYSIPLPPIDGDIATANSTGTPDPALLALLDVRYVAAEFDLFVNGLELVRQFDETRIYENTANPAVLWEISPVGDAAPASAVRYFWSPNRIDMLIERPGTYFISEVDYPGWEVVGAEALPPYEGIFRTFAVDTPNTQVVLVFRPDSLYAGLFLFILGAASVLVRHWMTAILSRAYHGEQDLS